MKRVPAGAAYVRVLLPATLTLMLACGGDSETVISGSLGVNSGVPVSAVPGKQPLANRTRAPAPQIASATTEARIIERREVMLSTLDRAELVPGEIIVKFRDDRLFKSAATASIQAAGLPLQVERSIAAARAQLYRAEGADRARTIEMIQELNQRPDVLYAQPNYVYQPLRVPSDEFFDVQWHYPAINLPGAWDITVGSASTVVAVVDTGILFDAAVSTRNHPDFNGKILPGFDFISDPRVAVDGDGRDGNPFDEGDSTDPSIPSSFHGSHVGGTIGAATDDGEGVAGVDWSARVLPVRALGAGGGSTLDILDGVLWAAGFTVNGVPANANPADVINLSLGGGAPCGPFEQQVYDAVNAEGVIVVVAAGNENQNASNVSPASCTGVITVGATDLDGRRAPYSNFGTRVDVMAPGGDLGADRNGDTFPDGVLSLGFDEQQSEFGFVFLQGTSMAAPHVAGVVALMKSLRPELTTEQAVAVLRNTARPLSAADCNRPQASECGGGLIDAQAALLNVDGGGPIATGPIAFQPDPLDFGFETQELSVTMTNTTGGALSWSVTGFGVSLGNPAELSDGTIYLPQDTTTSGTLAVGASAQMTIGVDRSVVTGKGIYAVQLVFDVNGAQQRLQVRFSTVPDGAGGPTGPTVVAAMMADENGEFQIVASREEDSFFSEYRLATEPGENMVIAWSDNNSNLDIDPGDHIGIYPAFTMSQGQKRSDVDVALSPFLNTSAVELLDDRIASTLESLLAAE